MLKKVISVCLMIFVGLFTVQALNNNIVLANSENKPNEYHRKYISAMDTDFSVEIDVNDPKANNYLEQLKRSEEIITNISILTDNFEGYDVLGEPVKNVYYINNNVNKKIEIDKVLYDILEFSLEVQVLTEGYFNISIGKIIDKWKDLIDPLANNNYTEEQFNKIVEEIKNIPIIDNGIVLTKENNKYYVLIKEGVKIDLGGIAKGYALDEVENYFKEEGLVSYKIKGSASSLKYGYNLNNDKGYTKVGVSNPFGGIYGYINVANKTVTTSGDTEQNKEFFGRLYHHIISPITKMPEIDNRIAIIVTESAALGDALSTAIFSMDKKKLEAWGKQNKLTEYIIIKSDKKIINNLKENEFVNSDGSTNIIKASIFDWLIISGVIIVFGVGIYYISKNNKSKLSNKEDSEE